MSLDDSDAKKLIAMLNELYPSMVTKIASFLNEEPLSEKVVISVQPEDSKNHAPLRELHIGLVSSLENEIVLDKDLLNNKKSVLETALKYTLIREIFTRYVLRYDPPEKFDPVVSAVISIMVSVWYVREFNIKQIQNVQLSTIRDINTSKKEGIFLHTNIDFSIVTSIIYDLPTKQYWDIIVLLLDKAKHNEWDLKEFDANFRHWAGKHIREPDYLAVPKQMSERKLEITKQLLLMKREEAAPKKVGKKLGLKHDVIDTAFKELYEEYNFYWRPRINYLLLRLYPYFFRVIFKSEHYEMLIEKLVANKYIHCMQQSKSYLPEKIVLSAFVACPHIVHEQLTNYFEKLKANGHIEDYFSLLMKRRMYTSSLTTKEISPSLENTQAFMNGTNDSEYTVVTLLDEQYNFTDLPKFNRYVFDEAVLRFISTVRADHLGKYAYYMTFDQEYREMLEKAKLKQDDEYAISKYLNQLDLRIRRLDLSHYFLNVLKPERNTHHLCVEVLTTEPEKTFEKLSKQFDFFPSLVTMEFSDRVLVNFPLISLDNPFVELIKEYLSAESFEYLIYNNRICKHLDRCVRYYELYDYEEKKWKY